MTETGAQDQRSQGPTQGQRRRPQLRNPQGARPLRELRLPLCLLRARGLCLGSVEGPLGTAPASLRALSSPVSPPLCGCGASTHWTRWENKTVRPSGVAETGPWKGPTLGGRLSRRGHPLIPEAPSAAGS